MTLDRIRNTRICNITTVCNITPLCIWLVIAMLLAAPKAEAVTTTEKNTDRMYQHLITGDLRELKKRGLDMIVENPDSSVMYFSAVAARYNDNLPDSDKDVCIGALNNLGYVYFYAFNNPLKAYDHLLRALRLSEETGIRTSLPHLYLNMANVFTAMGESQQSIDYLKKSIHSSAASKTHYILVISFIGLLNQVYLAEISSLAECGEEIRIFNSSGIDSSTELYDYARLMLEGIRKSDKKDYTGAISSFEQARKTINSKLTPERDYFVIGSAIAKAQLLQGNVAGAIRNLHEILYKTDAPDIKTSVYNQLSEAFQNKGDIDSCNYYSRLYLELSDSILHRGQLETLRGLDNQYMTDKLNAHIEKAARDRRNLMIVSVALLIIIAFGVWALISRRRLLHANQLLYEKSREVFLSPESQPTVQAEKDGEEPNEEHDDEESVGSGLEKKITEIFSSSQDVCSQDFTLERLAYLAGAPVRKVSRCLNDSMHTNFIAELQKARIREACRLFEDVEANGNLTIEAIAEMSGFKSRSNFVHVFKKVTGLTPSQYQKMSRER